MVRNELVYCPKCGRGTLQESGKKILCPCGFVLYLNTAAAVAGLINVGGRLLLTRRAREPKKGKLDLPGGFVDFGETAEQALVREVHEELNLEIRDIRFLETQPNTYLYKHIEYKVLDILFTCRADEADNIEPADDVADYVLCSLQEINIDDFAFVSTQQVVRKLQVQNKKNHG